MKHVYQHIDDKGIITTIMDGYFIQIKVRLSAPHKSWTPPMPIDWPHVAQRVGMATLRIGLIAGATLLRIGLIAGATFIACRVIEAFASGRVAQITGGW